MRMDDVPLRRVRERTLAWGLGRPERVPERLPQRLRADSSARKPPRDGRIGVGRSVGYAEPWIS